MENFYPLPLSSIFKKFTRYMALALMMLILGNLIASAQTPAITYASPQIFGKGITVTPFGPTHSTNVSALNYSSSTLTSVLNYGSAVAINAAGDVFFANSEEVYVKKAGGGNAMRIGSGYVYVSCIALDASGNLYVGEGNNQDILKITNPGEAGSVQSLFISGIGRITGMVFDKQDHLYIAQNHNPGDREVIRYKVTGGVASDPVIVATNFSWPVGVVIDKQNDLYVLDDGTIYKIPASATNFPMNAYDLTKVKTGLIANQGLAIDNGGNFFAVGYMNSKLERVDAITGAVTLLDGALYSASSVATDALGNVYVGNTNNQTVDKYVQTGGYKISDLPPGLLFNSNTGEISGTPTVITTAADHTITAYNTSGDTGNAIVNIQVLSGNADLSGITVSAGSLTPVFAANKLSYSASVVNNVSTLTVGASSADANSTISINGATAITATVSADVALAEGSNTITILVTAPGTNTKTYTLNITRQGPFSLAYAGPQRYAIGKAITALLPTSNEVSAFAYATQASFYAAGAAPTGIAVDKNGNIAVAVGTTVRKIAANGTLTASVSMGYTPMYVTFDDAGNIYTLSSGTGATFKKIDASNNAVTVIANGVTAASPLGLGIDPTGTYLFYTSSTSIRRLTISNGLNSAVCSGLSSPAGLTVNKAGDIFFSDGTGLYRIPATTTSYPVTKASLGGVYATGFGGMNGIAGGNAGEVFVSDFANKVVKRIDPSGAVSTISGTMTGPKWLAADNSGNVFVSDNSGTAVVRIKQNGGYYISPVLPTGLKFNTSTGAISGTPAKISAATAYTVTAYGAAGATVTNSLTITIVDPTLSALAVSQGTLSPAFNANTEDYTLSAGAATLKITPTVSTATSTVTVNGIAATSGQPSTITLALGMNVIPIVVTTDGSETKTYTLNITRVPAPSVAYSGDPYTFNTNTAIDPITPISSNVGTLSYSSFDHYYNTISSTAQSAAADQQGNAYFISGSIYKVPAGGGTAVAIPNTNAFYQSQALAADAEGNLYVGGFDASSAVSKITPDGTITQIASGFSYIYGIGLDGAGNIYINDAGVIKKIAAIDQAVSVVTTAISNAGPVGVDRAGNVYVFGGSTTSYIYKIPNTAGYPVALAQMTPMGSGLSAVQGVTIDNLGNIYSINQGSPRNILKTTPANVTTIIGVVPSPGTGIGVDGFGNIYTSSQGAPLGLLQNKQTGGYYVSPALPTGLTIDQNTGVISGTATVGTPATDYKISAYNFADNYTVATVNIKTTDASLSALSLSTGTLSPSFASSVNNYMAYTLSSSITVTPTALMAGSSITVNGISVTSVTSTTIDLEVGDNTINIAVTSQDGTLTKTYTVLVTRVIVPVIDYALTGTKIYDVGRAVQPLTPTSTGVGSYGTNGYPSSMSALSNITTAISAPWAIAADSSGNSLYVTTISNRVRKVTSGTVTNISGTYTQAYGVATDAEGNVFVADYNRGLTKNGVTVASGTTGIVSVTVDASGNIYLGKYSNSSILKIAAGSTAVTVFATGTPSPYGLATDAAGNLYVSKAEASGTLTRFTPAGVNTVISTGLNYPTGVEIDKSNNIYIVCVDKLLMIPSSVTTFPATPIAMLGNATFGAPGPGDVALDAANNLYITVDGNTDLIQKLTPNGGYYIYPALPAGLSFNNSTGVISGTPTKPIASKNYIITAYNSAGIKGTTNISLKTTYNSNLSSLSINNGTLTPVFEAATTSYTASIPHDTTSVTIAARTADPSASIQIKLNNGSYTAAATDSTSTFLALNFGDNLIEIKVTAADGTTAKTYTVSINRPVALPSVSTSAVTGIFNDAATLNGNVSADGGAEVTEKGIVYSTTINPTIVDTKLTSEAGIGAITALAAGLNANTTYYARAYAINSAGTAYGSDVTFKTNYATPAIPVTPVASNVVIDGFRLNWDVQEGVETYKLDISTQSDFSTFIASYEDQPVTSGVSITGLLPLTTYYYRLRAINISGSSTSSTTGNVKTPGASNAHLNGMSIIAGQTLALDPAFDAMTENYDAGTVDFLVKDVTIQAVAADVNATIKAHINSGAPISLTSGITSASLPLELGANVIHTTVTAQNGTTTKQYSVTLHRDLPVSLIQSMSLSTGSVITAVADSYEYMANVEGFSRVNVKLIVTLVDNTSTMTINGVPAVSGVASSNIAVNAAGTTDVMIVITPGTGPAKTYVLHLNRVASVNTKLAYLYVLNNTVDLVNDSTYTANVAGLNTASVQLYARTTDLNASVTINGTPVPAAGAYRPFPLNASGSTTFNIVVTAENGVAKKTYTLTVGRSPANNTKLTSLLALGNTLNVVNDSTYTADVTGLNTAAVQLYARTADQAATVAINGTTVPSAGAYRSFTLNSTGTTTFNILVTAEDGVTRKNYTLTLGKAPAVNTKLAYLYVLNNTVDLVNDSTYTANVAGLNTASVQLYARTTDLNASVTINGTPVPAAGAYRPFPLNASGSTTFNIVVTAENGVAKKTYTLTVGRSPANNTKLTSLLALGNTLNVVNDSTYTADVTGLNTAAVQLYARTADQAATVAINGTTVPSAGAYRSFTLNSTGTTTFNILVTAEDGVTRKNYTLTLGKAPAVNTKLAYLYVLNNTVDLVNDSTYTANVAGLNTASVQLYARTTDLNASVTINGTPVPAAGAYRPFPLNASGSTTFNIVVTAENGVAKKTYTLTVGRSPANNTKLTSLLALGNTLNVVNDSTYTADVTGLNTAAVQLYARTADQAATVAINGTTVPSAGAYRSFTLNSTGTTTFNILVTAEDGVTRKNYTLTLGKAPAVNTKLAYLYVLNNTVDLVNDSTYTANVAGLNTASVQLYARTTDLNASVTINGTPVPAAGAYRPFPLNASGSTTFNIVVTAENGVAKKTYILTIIKPGSNLFANIQAESQQAVAPKSEILALLSTSDEILPHQSLSPNSDGVSDIFRIDGIEKYPTNKVTIIHRNGARVFEIQNYDNAERVFKGRNNINGAQLPSGTYFYLVEYVKDRKTQRKTGYLILKY